MKKLKNLIGCCLVAAMITLVPTTRVEASSNTYLERVEASPNNIDVAIDGFNYEAKSFQLELKLEGNVTLESLKWSDPINKEEVKKNYVYDKAANTVKIYVTSKNNLVEYSKLSVCRITVKGDMDTTYNVTGNGTFKYIFSNQNKEGKIETFEIKAPDNFNYVYDTNNEENPDEGKPDDGGNPGDGNTDGENPDDEANGDNESTPGNGEDSSADSNEESSANNGSNPNSASSRPIKTGDVVTGVLTVAGVSLAATIAFRPRGKHSKKKGKRFKK